MIALKQSIVAVLLCSISVFPWGKVGHETVAYIAEQNLSQAVKDKIKPLLAGETLVDISTWPDEYKKDHRETAPWHYLDLPVRQDVTANNISHYYSSQSRHGTDNIVSQIKENINKLKNQTTSFQEKQIALKYLVHFVGDMHQPLHMADDNDKRGNDKRVIYFGPTSHKNKGRLTTLHPLWNNLIEIKPDKEDPSELGKSLANKISKSEKLTWDSGTVEDWAIESYSIAKNVIYRGFSTGPTTDAVSLPDDYYFKMRPICEEQLEKAGVRLAFILDEIFGK
jgi:hypothetical protein